MAKTGHQVREDARKPARSTAPDGYAKRSDALTPVTRRGSITQKQADGAVRSYLRSEKRR